jgi:hypothetical protein
MMATHKVYIEVIQLSQVHSCHTLEEVSRDERIREQRRAVMA